MGKNVSKRRRIVIGLAGALVLFAAVVLFLLSGVRKTNGIPLLEFSTGQKLKGYTVWDSQNRELDVSEITTNSTLVVFAMDGCKDCIAAFADYRILFPLYNSEEFSVVFLWDNKIPQEQLDQLHIPPEASYSAKGKYKFTDWVPSYYFLDQNDTITAQTIEMAEVARLLPKISVNSQNVERLSGGKPILLGVDGCGACKKKAKELAEAGTDYLYFLQGEKLTADSPENMIPDKEKLVSKAFGIEEYPVYIYKTPTGEFVVEK